ncbi:hypothetical protein CKA32_001092 [Geitlerinema sp. FC II]|nr:hypothetical protein CKA32_001092 [Geitlerinema sp. FC II]
MQPAPDLLGRWGETFLHDLEICIEIYKKSSSLHQNPNTLAQRQL